MEKTYTITQEQLDQVFLNIQVVNNIKNDFEREGKEQDCQNYLFDFCGRLTVLMELGLLKEWDAWRAKQAQKAR